MAVVYQSPERGETRWDEAGRTDVVANSHDPEFIRPVVVSYTPQGRQPLRIVLYDVDTLKSDVRSIKLASQDYLGEAEVSLSEVLAAPNKVLEVPLLDMVKGQQLPKGCVLELKAEELVQANQTVRLLFSAEGLGNASKRVDPFLKVLKQRPSGDWVPLFKTEVRSKNPEPIWAPIEVDILQLCSADEQRPLKLQVYNYDKGGQHKLLGEAVSSLAALRALVLQPLAARKLDLLAPGAAALAGLPATAPSKQGVVALEPAGRTALGLGEATGVAAPAAGSGLGGAVAEPAPAAPPPSAAAPAGSGVPGGSKTGTLVVRQVQVREGLTASDRLADKLAPFTIVGGGRVGEALAGMGPGHDVVVKRGEAVQGPEGPIVVCTRNDDLQAVVDATPADQRKDLVFIQNGMLQPWLEERGLGDNTQVLVYFAVAKKGDPPTDGKTDVNPEGLTAAHGPHAEAFAERLHAAGLSCKVLSKDEFQKSMLEKLIWISAFMLVGARHGGCTVGQVEAQHRDEVDQLIQELAAAGAPALGVSLNPGVEDRLLAYARSVAHFPTAVKEFQWRNGWFWGLSQQAAAGGRPDPCPKHSAWLKEVGAV
ncbi:hypothetical protein N2152v2_008807 [Parachlorella kessleri]